MRKKSLLLFLVLIATLSSILFCACVKKSQDPEEVTLTSISVVETTVPTDAIKGSVDVTQIQLQLVFSNGDQTKMTIDSSMLTEESRAKLNEVGTHTFTVVYQKKIAKFQMQIRDDSVTYYSLRVYGGVPTYINDKKIVNAIQLPESGYYESTYPEGTTVTIQWISDGNNFSYWTANDLPVSSESIVTVTVDGNLVYRPYSNPSVSTVSFKTFSSSVIQSKTTNMLFEADISAVYRDNYIFAGWTTDEINETQSLSGYDQHIVTFPYEVNRNVTFYATWLPLGIVYSLVGDHYEIVGYEGNALSIDIPEKFNGRDVTTVRAGAFDRDNARVLRSISLPSTIQTIEEGAFANCAHLSSFSVASGSAYEVIDGVLYSADGKELVAYPANKTAEKYNILAGVTKVDAYAFYNAVVGSVTLPSTVDSVGESAFDSVHIDHLDFSAVSPTSLVLPRKLFNEKLNAVVCSSVSSELFTALFPAVNEIADKIVVSVNKTNRVYLYDYDEADGQRVSILYRIVYDKNLVDESAINNDPESYATAEIMGVTRTASTFAVPIRLAQPGDKAYTVTSLADYAFKNCTLLDRVVISFSSRLERIGEEVFTDTPWIKTIENDTLQANNVVYKYLGKASTYRMNTNTVKIAEGAFRGNTALQYVDIGVNAALTTIAPHAFDGCSSFVGFICDANVNGDGLYLKYAVRSIGEYAFRDTAVTSVKLQPSSAQQVNCLAKVGSFAFENCLYLTSVTLSRSTTDIASDAFVGCVSLSEFVLAEKNPVFEVYEGILYKYNSSGEYTLFTYPAGRLDGEFDPSYVRLYGFSLDFDLADYTGSDAVPVGTVLLNGAAKDVYLTIRAGVEWSVAYDAYSETYYLKDADNNRLLPSKEVRVTEDGSFVMSGDYYLSVLSDDNTRRIPLLYDEEKDAYYYYPVMRQFASSLSVDLSSYEESSDKNVGTILIGGKTFNVYLYVDEGIEIAKGSDVVPVNKSTNERLRQTTSVFRRDDGSLKVNGEFYYYVYLSEDKTEKTVLIYDAVSGKYCFDGYLNVVAIGSDAFSYSSVSAVRISALIRTIGENAFNVPGLLYLRFDSNPAVFSYASVFGEYKPDCILLSDRLSQSDKVSFFDNDYDLMSEKISAFSYRFIIGDNAPDVIYVLCEDDANLSVARTSRNAENVIVTETVVSGGVTYTQVKKVLPYAFYGVYLKSVTLRGVGALASNAFSKASLMTALYIETDFISDVQEDTFGPLFHNGLYIYDAQNGFNLYRESKWVPAGTVFTYTDIDGMERSSCPYLILNDEKKSFAVITYVDGQGNVQTADILYGVVSVEDVGAIQSLVARAGYDIIGWRDENDNVISGDSDYSIPHNQVLSCIWAPQTYKVFFVVSEGEVKKAEGDTYVSLAVQQGSVSNLTTYVSEVRYGEEYSFAFVGYNTLSRVFLHWKDDSETEYVTSGVWNVVLESREIYLYPVTDVRTYLLTYSVDADVTVASSGRSVAYDASGWTLDVPTCDDYTFQGWYMIGAEGERIVLTDSRGYAQLSWRYTDEDEYTVYALWNSVLLYRSPVADISSETIDYNKNFTLATPIEVPNKTFIGWYFLDADNREIMISDAAGNSLAPWTYDGKKQYHIFAKWRSNE